MADIKAGRDIGPRGAGTNRLGVSAIADAQPECVEHDRLARPGLPGDAGHTGIEVDLELVDNGIVLYREIDQHDAVRKALVTL